MAWSSQLNTRAESFLRSGVYPLLQYFQNYFDDKKSENSDLCLLEFHHVIKFRNFYLVFLSVSQCQGIAPTAQISITNDDTNIDNIAGNSADNSDDNSTVLPSITF